MSDRTIKVKGVGSIKIKVDYIIVTLELNNIDIDYEQVMMIESKKLNAISNSLIKIGFEKKDIKTVDFKVSSKYEAIRDKNNNYKEIFKGYQCYHQLKIAFEYDMTLLNRLLSVISKNDSQPKINISFTVKDQNEISEKLLKSSCYDAKRKAEILCTASGYKLGELLKIDYDWSEIYFESHTQYDVSSSLRKKWFYDEAIDIEPEDISASDSAVFIWKIES